jgi:hypothetical protein
MLQELTLAEHAGILRILYAVMQADALAAELARIHRHRCGGMTDPDTLFKSKGLSTRQRPATWRHRS